MSDIACSAPQIVLGMALDVVYAKESEKIVVGVLSRYRGVVSALLVATVLAIGAAWVAAVPAHAEFREYSCKSCASANGPEVFVSESMKSIGRVEGATGVCAAAWEYLGGGNWKEFLACTATGTEVLVVTGYIGPFEGHGQVRRYYAKYLYNLWGQEDWI
jgi:hypothetical protein